MIKPRILDKNLLIMRKQIGAATHQFNGEKIEISRSLDGMSIIVGYKGKSIIWNIKDMVEESIELIDGVPLEEE
mgnify:CR=1 FL=1|jgi:hypothetical protein|nr:MAG TPA: hypothetical protein [Caudoviricetes sp.]